MRAAPAIAACAALALTFASCDDDDDDDDDDDAAATTTTVPAAVTTAVPEGGAATAAPDDAAPTTAAAPAGTGDPAIAADCATFQAFIDEMEQIETPPAPRVDEEISDEFKDSVRTVLDGLEELEFETDAVDDAVDQAEDYFEELLDADTMTQDLVDRLEGGFAPITNVCGPYFAAAAATTAPA